MTAPDPRLDEIQARLSGPDAEFIGYAHIDVAYLLAELRAARATNERLNRRAQVAEAALNAVTSEGRAGIREDKLLHEYWQRAEDARAELRKAHAAVRAARFVVSVREAELLKLKGPCSNNECTLHYAHSGPCNEDRTQARAAVAAANGDGEGQS